MRLKQIVQHMEYGPDTEKFYELIFQSITDYAVFTTDKEGIITTWNPGAQKLFQYPWEEISGMNAAILYTPQDISNDVPAKEMEETLAGGRTKNERYHVRKDQRTFWGSGLVFLLLDEEGEHIGFTKVIRDLTTHKETEEKLLEARAFSRSIVETASNAMLVLNKDLTINCASTSFYDFFSITPEKVLEKNVFEIWDHEELKKFFQDTLAHRDSAEIEMELHTVKFGMRILTIRARRLFWINKTVEFIKISFEDITYRRTLERHKDTFIGIASHELKTPVTVIRAFAQMIEREVKQLNIPSLLKATAKINEQALKLSELSSDLLNMTQLEAGSFQLNRKNLNLLPLLESIMEDLEHIYPCHKLTLKNRIEEAIVYVDKTKISEVMVNLLNNAVKYSPDADEVILDMYEDKGSNSIVICIQDFGIGIPEEEQKHIFKRFTRTNQVREKNISGHGLGLYIACEITTHHGGKIWLESEKDKGSKFFLSLPKV